MLPNSKSNTKSYLIPSAPATILIDATSEAAVAANAERKGLVLTNLSNSIISLGLGAAAVIYSGISLTPNGGTWVMDEYTHYTGAINAIAEAANSELSIQEFT